MVMIMATIMGHLKMERVIVMETVEETEWKGTWKALTSYFCNIFFKVTLS